MSGRHVLVFWLPPWANRTPRSGALRPAHPGFADVIAYRSEDHNLWATVRKPDDGGGYAQVGWPQIARTNIPNDNSNLNAGPLPDGALLSLCC